jgi:transposase InsO family protein
LDELARSGESMAVFCARRQVTTATICAWKRALRAHGEAGLVPREPRRNPTGKSGRVRTPEERRAAVEAFQRASMTVEAFARTYGVSPWTLRCWLARYAESGPKGLEPRARGRAPGSVGSLRRVSDAVRTEIARTKQRFPDFGLKKVRDFLRRFQGIAVSTGTVARTLEERGVERVVPPRKRRAQRPLPRLRERAQPGELWQTDITSFVLARPGTRVYLVAFVDDFSRYVVSFGLYVQMRSATVIEVLLEGCARYGKPREVLTDQGPQYFTWRGKSAFQKQLLRAGIRHVVARSHHPQTLGKCERLWETVKREFWERARPDDLTDARKRLVHFFAHYNFFRPHQGIDGAVPADRFFGAEHALRRTLEAQLSQRELEAALEEAPRKSVYLFGQIGDEQVSVVGERGELVVQTSSGVRQRMGLDELGAPSTVQKEGRNGSSERREDGNDAGARTATPHGQEAAALRPAAEVSARSAGAVEQCDGGGAEPCAPGVGADPGDVAGQAPARGGERYAEDSTAAGVAAQPASFVGHAGGPVASAAPAACESGGDDAGERRRSARAQEDDRAASEANRRSGGPDPALDERAQASERAVGDGGADAHDENALTQDSTPR